MSESVKFNLEITMPKRWVKKFMQMLDCMRWCGKVGASRVVGFFADGDGDFRPFDFKVDGKEIERLVNWYEVDRIPFPKDGSSEPRPEFKKNTKADFFFDAG